MWVRTISKDGISTLTSFPDTKRIIGYKKEESDALLKFLFDHIANSQDCQARIKWAEKTVVLFDVGPWRKAAGTLGSQLEEQGDLSLCNL